MRRGLSSEGVLEKYIGTAYDAVAFVTDHLEEIKKAAELFELNLGTLFYRYVATAGQTIFTGADEGNRVLNLEAPVPVVYVNRILMDATEFNILGGGTQVEFLVPLAAGDTVHISAFGVNPDGSVYFDSLLSQANITQILTEASQARDDAQLAETGAQAAEAGAAGNAAAAATSVANAAASEAAAAQSVIDAQGVLASTQASEAAAAISAADAAQSVLDAEAQVAILTALDPLLPGDNLAALTDKPAALVNLGLTATAAELNAAADVDLQAKDLIINGAFDVWQYGTSHTAAGYGSASRWAMINSGGTVTMSKQAFALGDALGQNAPTSFLRLGVTGQSGTHNAGVQQKIEGVRSYAGETITILGWIKRNSGAGSLGVRILQNFGSGGAPSANVVSAQQIVALTGAWTPFAVTFDVPSIAGKTLGTSGNDNLAIQFHVSDGATGLGIQTIEADLWGIHIRRGTHPASVTGRYQAPSVEQTLRACERYYVEMTASLQHYAAYANGFGVTTVSWPTTMRATPTLSKSNGTTANLSSSTVGQATVNSCSFTIVSSAAGQVRNEGATIKADAEL